MCKMNLRLTCALILLAAGLLCLGTPQAVSQTTEPPETGMTDPQPPDAEDTEMPSMANPPAYIRELIEAGGLTQEQADRMRTDGLGWGEIRIATRLAEQIAANSGGTLPFDDALAQVLTARAEGKGFGEIAAANNLKIGELIGSGNQKAGGDPQKDSAASKGGQGHATAAAGQEKKPGFFARVGKFLGFGRSADKPAKRANLDRPPESAKALKGDKPERPIRLDRGAKPEKPTRLEKPSRPEKPEKGPHR